MKKNKVLIIRFSSFGDIVQCSSVVEQIAQNNQGSEIHWVTRKEFKELVELNQNVQMVYGLDRRLGILGLIKLAFFLRKNKYDLIYDAHNNLRSNFLYLFFLLSFSNALWVTRSKDRFKRIMLFRFRKNYFPKPFKGIDSFLAPLIKIGYRPLKSDELVKYKFKSESIEKIKSFIVPQKKILTIVPSAAWEMKRWPLEHWKQLLRLNKHYQIYILGGAEDLFCEDLKNAAPDNCVNLAGKLSLIESCAFISKSDLVVSADTGLLHVADVLGVKGISLMGPTAFGFTKSNLIKTLELEMSCRPCSKDGSGKCSQAIYQQCLVDITPERVNQEINNFN